MYHLKQVFKDSGENFVRPLGETYSFFSRQSTGFDEHKDIVNDITDDVYGILSSQFVTQVLHNGCLYYVMTDDGRTIERL